MAEPAEWLSRLRCRSPCPFDPRHSILLTKLPGHLRLCQLKPGVSAAAAAGTACPPPHLTSGAVERSTRMRGGVGDQTDTRRAFL